MQSLPTRLQGPQLLEPRIFPDERGFFCETFRASELADLGITEQFVQDNHSRSARGVVRGMHFHIGPGVSKLIRCSRGEILDVLVDLRRGSPTHGQWEGYNLSEENMHILYAPIGFAHGFCVISEIADVLYKQSAYYDPDIERGIALDDPDIAIDWPITPTERIISTRDTEAPRLSEIADELPFS
jgi:dTDP-4-dehydrorhamnose 3,5-epimerase